MVKNAIRELATYNAPQPNWVPLVRAPFYYTWNSYLFTPEE